MTIGFIFITYTAEQKTTIILKEKQRHSCRVLYQMGCVALFRIFSEETKGIYEKKNTYFPLIRNQLNELPLVSLQI